MLASPTLLPRSRSRSAISRAVTEQPSVGDRLDHLVAGRAGAVAGGRERLAACARSSRVGGGAHRAISDSRDSVRRVDVFRTPDERFESLPGYVVRAATTPRSTACGCTTSTRARAIPSSASTASRPGPTSTARCWRRWWTGGHRVVCPDSPASGARTSRPTSAGTPTTATSRPCRRCSGDARPVATRRSSSRTGAGRSACAGRSRTPTASARLVILNTGLFTGRVSKGFMAWRDFAEKNPDLPVGLRDPGRARPPSCPTTWWPPTRRRSPTPSRRPARPRSRCSCPPRRARPARPRWAR